MENIEATKTEVVKTEKTTSYLSNGQEVILSHQIVRNYLTKGNNNVTDADIVQFIGVCKFNGLNPFLSEAYLIKYGDKPAQMVVSKEALFRRAESHPEFDGILAGVIVQRGEDIIELEGSFLYPNDKLLGAYAMAYRKDRKYPFVSKINLDEFDKKQSLWNEKKALMIVKVAKTQALREAFPSSLNAMYIEEEQSDINYNRPKNVQETKAKIVLEYKSDEWNKVVRDHYNGITMEQLHSKYDFDNDMEAALYNEVTKLKNEQVTNDKLF